MRVPCITTCSGQSGCRFWAVHMALRRARCWQWMGVLEEVVMVVMEGVIVVAVVLMVVAVEVGV